MGTMTAPETRGKRGSRFSNLHLDLLKRAVCLALVFVLVLPMLPMNLSWASAGIMDFVVSGPSFSPHFYTSFSDAWNAATRINGSITMNTDAKIGKRLTLGENHTVTINMNGYMINRGNTNPSKIKAIHDSDGEGTIFFLDKNSKLIIKGGSDEASKAKTHNTRI